MMTRAWGCPKCGHQESRVDDTGRDEDGYVIRNRRCTRCQTTWATEELPIRMGFWTRAHSRNAARQALNRQRKRICKKCGGAYQYGAFNYHVRLSERHAAAIKPPANRGKRETVRNYQREWVRRRRLAA